MGGRNRTPDCRMDCSSAHGGMWLGAGSTVPHPRSRSHLWRGRHPAPLGAADQRSTDIAALAVAKCLCRTAVLVGSVRRECVDHVVVLGERHLRHVLLSYMKYYNETRTHLSLNKDAPIPRAVQAAGRILCLPILGGLHHQYGRI
jgi:hypothetical protein